MSQPALKPVQVTENSVEIETEVKSVETDGAPAECQVSLSIAHNSVKNAVEEFKSLIDEMDDLRELLRAHGIPLRTTRLIVELGVQNKNEKQSVAIDSAMEHAQKTLGNECLERHVLENHIATIVTLENDLSHARSVARGEGLDAQALSMLTQMVTQNPGDGGTKAVNTLLAYAIAYGVKTEQLTELVSQFTQRTASVLPHIQRESVKPGLPLRKLMQDAMIGIFIGAFVMWLLV